MAATSCSALSTPSISSALAIPLHRATTLLRSTTQLIRTSASSPRCLYQPRRSPFAHRTRGTTRPSISSIVRVSSTGSHLSPTSSAPSHPHLPPSSSMPYVMPSASCAIVDPTTYATASISNESVSTAPSSAKFTFGMWSRRMPAGTRSCDPTTSRSIARVSIAIVSIALSGPHVSPCPTPTSDSVPRVRPLPES